MLRNLAYVVSLVAVIAACHTSSAPAARGQSGPSGTERDLEPTPAPIVLPAGTLEPRGMIMIGDLHGTVEIPAFVASLVVTLSRDQPVVLALEVPRQDTPGIEPFLASDGGRPAIEQLLRDPWWHFRYQDGRRSVAMLDLIRAVRGLRARGAKVDIALFDAGPGDSPANDPGGREEFMAKTLAALRDARSDAAIVVYAGNLHTRRNGTSPMGGDKMAKRLAARGVRFVTINPRYRDGSAWVCRASLASSCGPSFIAGRELATGVHLEPSADGNYDGWFGVGEITASPPAALPEAARGLPERLAAIRKNAAILKRAAGASDAEDWKACADAYSSIAEPSAEDAYNHAGCLAQLGHRDAAFERLQYAVDREFVGAADIAAEPAFAPLHADPRWPPKPRSMR